MNLENVLVIGLKVVLALGTGVAVFAGINQAVKESSTTTGLENNNVGNNFNVDNNNNNLPAVPCDNKIISGLRATQDTCSKILGVIGSVTTAVECIVNIFRGNQFNYGYCGGFGNQNMGFGYPYQTQQSPYGYGCGDGTRLFQKNRYIQVCY